MRAPSAARCVYKLVEFDGNPRIKLSQEIRKACHPPPLPTVPPTALPTVASTSAPPMLCPSPSRAPRCCCAP